jgi:hypothetical protein
MRHAACLALVLIGLSNAQQVLGAPESAEAPHPGQVQPTNDTEKWLDTIIIPEIAFRADNMLDCLGRVQKEINTFAVRNEHPALRVLFDLDALRHLRSNPLLPTFSAKDISAFRVIKLLEVLGPLRLVVRPEGIIVEMADRESANTEPEATR